MPPLLPRVAVVVLLLAGGPAVLPGSPAYAERGGDWSLAPAGGQDGRPYFYLEGAPGAVLEDTVTVTNPGDRARTVRLRGADARNDADGSFAIEADGKSRDGGAWIRLAEQKVTVPPRTRAEVPFTVTVPDGAVPGDHPAAIVASGAGRTSGVRLHLRVGGPTLSALTVERVRLADDGRRITYDLVNRGNTVLAPKLAVRADGLFGEALDRAPRGLPVELLPGRRVTLSEPWPDAPALDSVDVRLTATAQGGARDTAVASATFVPWGAMAGLAGALTALAAGARWLRGRRDREPDKAEPPQNDRELTGAAT
ncbi:WxL protein peptidoglycan domain-containing protein [Streptomyces sp. Da 82-17]|uniref:COG1470 family protein n=1 Tax=Streptomyces sp. Da 82-17 TaxID=3377116 RepID=UPI0038D407B7